MNKSLEMKGIVKAFPVSSRSTMSISSCARVRSMAWWVKTGGQIDPDQDHHRVYRKDDGEMRLGDQLVDIQSPIHAQQLGISVIHQELSLCPYLSVRRTCSWACSQAKIRAS